MELTNEQVKIILGALADKISDQAYRITWKEETIEKQEAIIDEDKKSITMMEKQIDSLNEEVKELDRAKNVLSVDIDNLREQISRAEGA